MPKQSNPPKVRFFEQPSQLRKWLEAHHLSALELWVGFYKKSSGKPSVTWPEVVEESLCFGWIDGVRKSIDEESYMIRLTPRRTRSIWSAINIRLAERLIQEKRMCPAGLKAFECRTVDRSRIYSYEKEKHVFTEEYLAEFKSHKRAWSFFESQPPSYRRLTTFWVIDAKKEETRRKRLAELIRVSEEGRRVGLLKRKD
jgi:uncharacterized protein YdeI (YjbR/CyaY-like superfamily)